MYCKSGEFCSFSLSNERNGRLSKSASVASFSSAFSSSTDLRGLCGQKMKDSVFYFGSGGHANVHCAITFDRCSCRLSTRFDCSLWSMHLPKNGRAHSFLRRCCCAIDSVFPLNEKNKSHFHNFTSQTQAPFYFIYIDWRTISESTD